MYQRKTSILILHLFPNSSGQKIVLSLRERLHSKTIDFPPIVTSEACVEWGWIFSQIFYPYRIGGFLWNIFGDFVNRVSRFTILECSNWNHRIFHFWNTFQTRKTPTWFSFLAQASSFFKSTHPILSLIRIRLISPPPSLSPPPSCIGFRHPPQG